MEKKIVVAVDESEESMYALSWCLTNLFTEKNITNTLLVLLYIKPPPLVYSSIDAPGCIFAGDVIESMEKHSRDLVNSVMNRAETVLREFQTNIEVERKVGSGDAKEVICVAVDKLRADILVVGSHDYGFFKRADILVVGSHDYGFFKRTLLGSVSDYCSKNVKCPLVVIKRPKKDILT